MIAGLCCFVCVGGVTRRRQRIAVGVSSRNEFGTNYLNRDADKIVLDQDNLNTHKPASLYAAFPSEEARRLIDKLEIHNTPKHGSGLRLLSERGAEIELGILGRQCLDRRITDREKLQHEVAAWQRERNKSPSKVDWQFTTAHARVKLKHLYPITKTSNPTS